MSEWKNVALSDLAHVKHGYAFPGENIKDQPPGDILLTPGNFAIGGGFKDNKFKYFDGEVPEDYVLNENDLIVTMTDLSKQGDTLGYPAIVPKSERGRFLHNQRVGRVEILDETLLDKRFLFYLFKTKEYRDEILAGATGTSIKHTSPNRILAFRMDLPSVTEQRLIAQILGALDKKIDLNRQINQSLEHIAQAMFKSWFVDFEPVRAKVAAIEAGGDQQAVTRAAMRAISAKTDAELDQLLSQQPEKYGKLQATAELFPSAMQETELGEIPESWKHIALPEVIEINPMRQLKKGAIAPYLDMANVPTNSARAQNVIEREFGSGSKFINGDTLLARITPCLENGKTAFVDFLDDGQVGWGSTEFIVLRPKVFLPVEFAYFLCRHPEFRDFAIGNMTGTSGRQRVPNDCFQNYFFTLPSQSIAESFGHLIAKTMADIKALDMESRTLANLRDILLPKLLSCELDVSAVPEMEG